MAIEIPHETEEKHKFILKKDIGVFQRLAWIMNMSKARQIDNKFYNMLKWKDPYLEAQLCNNMPLCY